MGDLERRVGSAAAYVGGAITAAGTVAAGILLGQVVMARLTIPGAEAPPPRSNGLYGREYGDGAPLRLAVLGDSTAAGYGVHTRAETPGALLAGWIAEAAARPVRLTCPAVVGSVSAWLAGQVETVLEAGADLAIIFIGANDVTGRAGAAAAARHLAEAVHDLRATGAEVVVATCPDLGTVQPIQPPLRWLARRWSRQLAEAQTLAVLREGGRTVSLGDLVSPAFGASPDTMFGDDRFHPSAEGYRAAANAVLPTALEALGLAAPGATGFPVPLHDAAALAAKRPGTAVQPVGAWALIRRYASRFRPQSAPATAAQNGGFAVPSLSGELASSD